MSKDNSFHKSRKGSYFPKGGENDNSKPRDKFEPVQAKPLQIIVQDGQFDRALRAFRALVQKERILSTYKEKQRYEKPSDKKRRKRAEAAQKRFEMEMSHRKKDRS